VNKTGIEWCDYTVNPVKGYCPMACEYCYARAMYERFKWDKTIRYDYRAWNGLEKVAPGSHIFVGSTIELFGDWVDRFWLSDIFAEIIGHPQKTFIVLTKLPENLAKWNPWPDNCWVGATATNFEQWQKASDGLTNIQAAIKYISFEPLLEDIGSHIYAERLNYVGVKWVILGGKSGKGRFYPPEEWIEEIEQAADKAGIPVFEKNNLRPKGDWIPRREWPKCLT